MSNFKNVLIFDTMILIQAKSKELLFRIFLFLLEIIENCDHLSLKRAKSYW